MQGRTTKFLKVVLTITMILSAIVTVALVLPLKQILIAISVWIDHHAFWGALLLPILFCVAIPVAIPATMLEILAGSVFGLAKGTIVNMVGKTCGSVVAFLIGKHLGKERVGSHLHTKFPMFTALSSVLEGSNRKPLLLIQLSSIPPVIKCYGLSMTNISVARFAITSMVGGAPNSALWAYIGSQTRDIVAYAGETDPTAANTSRWSMLAIGLACTVLAMACLFVYTRRELQKQLHEARKKKEKDKESSSDEESDDDGVGSIVPFDTELCEVVMAQVVSLETPQTIAKRASIV